ncbi:HNH endonuclease [Modestobacter sp. DSM 44400]|uniref:HNH endonuclease signature motif containing protein n=1 Tax=Modestobacter sp. DSM 44400 TaxID=1550230 RepID=UPI0008944E94|nr:HNH endonuclease signature motif containing protein [Modestobacter sp. DSM 44400]SDY68632.1 HNH endonuclease [Modestobacter sp. DSM 44400]
MIEATRPDAAPPPDGTPAEPLDHLADRIRGGAVRLAAATAAWLRLVADFDEREGWAGVGITSCAHWLAWQCGLTPGTARQHARVARALRKLPVIEEAFAGGELSYSKVRALTRVAEPATEAELVEFARHATASQVERTVRAWRRADDVDAGRITDRRLFSWSFDEDGMVSIRLRMAPEQGTDFLAAIESLAEREARRDRAATKRAATDPGGGATCADPEVVPLGVMTERRCRALTQLAVAAADADRRAGDPPRREVVVVVDAAVLADDEAAGRAHLEGGPAISPSQARRLACDAALTVVLTESGQVLAQGRARRYATRAQRRALLVRDGGCARPGCDETRIERLHAHHLRHWLSGGRTDVSNMVLLCDVDHGLVHDLDLVLTRPGGVLVATSPDGRRLWGPAESNRVLSLVPRRFRGTAGADDAVLDDLLPAAGTLPAALPTDGERMDLHHVVWALMAHRDVVRRRAA